MVKAIFYKTRLSVIRSLVCNNFLILLSARQNTKRLSEFVSAVLDEFFENLSARFADLYYYILERLIGIAYVKNYSGLFQRRELLGCDNRQGWQLGLIQL
ncbi:MAG: hypothetical protein IJT14_01805 [Rickettsiales bacterium]|nr:hypothetical protein [Rickettsiales bacterium]